MTKRWFVAQAVRNREIAAALFATQRGFESYVPAIQRPRKIGLLMSVESVPRFGAYIFVRFDRENDPWADICRHTRTQRDYFKRILCDADSNPSPVPDLVMEAIRAYRPQPEQEAKAPHVYRPGERVTWCLAGNRRDAVFVQYEGNRQFVRTWLFGAERLTEVAAAELEPLELDNPQDLATGCAT